MTDIQNYSSNMNRQKTSRIPQFYKKSLPDRTKIIQEWSNTTDNEIRAITGDKRLSAKEASQMIENALGTFNLPLGIATNFLINSKDYLVPMAIEEPSVVAAVSNSAKLFRHGGGFNTKSDDPIMIGQIQILDIPDINEAHKNIQETKDKLLDKINSIGGSIVERGGGARDIQIRQLKDERIGDMLIVHLLYDCRDAMGANIINTSVEYIAPDIEVLTEGRVNLRILSNLTDTRKAYAKGMIPAEYLSRKDSEGKDVAKSIVEAGIFAEIDPYRATTHNKGIMNGIDAVVVATGNDWRAIEAGAHAYAARSGTYSSLTRWWQDEEGNLHGSIELPLAVGIIGGATLVHPTAQAVLKILDVQSAQELAEVIACVGLAQNFGAIRALATEGIQKGHMRMHARQIAIAAGADDAQVLSIVKRMISEGNIRLGRAKELLEQINHQSDSL